MYRQLTVIIILTINHRYNSLSRAVPSAYVYVRTCIPACVSVWVRALQRTHVRRSCRTGQSHQPTQNVGQCNWPVHAAAYVSRIDRRTSSIDLGPHMCRESTNAQRQLIRDVCEQDSITLFLCASIHKSQIDSGATLVDVRHVWTIQKHETALRVNTNFANRPTRRVGQLATRMDCIVARCCFVQ